MADDADIMLRVQAGQVHLFDELVRRYRPALVRVACSKLGEAGWAEDVVQEAFLAAYTARHSYNPQFAFRTWLWTILLNLCRSQWRRREARPREASLQEISGVSPAAREPTSRATGLSILLHTERLEQLHRTLAGLPEAQADALRLRFLAELPFAEVAAAMNSSQSAAKQRVKLGLENLALLLRDHAGDDL